LRKPLVEICILGKNSGGRSFEFSLARELLLYARLNELLDRNTALIRRSFDLACDLIRNVEFERFHGTTLQQDAPGSIPLRGSSRAPSGRETLSCRDELRQQGQVTGGDFRLERRLSR